MFKSTTARVVGFVGALGVSATLLGAAAGTTGAYFTDREAGTIAASAGTLTVDGTNNYNLSFDRLIPGQYRDKQVTYRTGGDTPTDIWLHFPDGASYAKFTGAKNGQHWADGGLGRFGHFEVASNAGNKLFSSWNLQNESDTSSGCANVFGHGSNQPPVNRADTPAYCGVPHYILIEQNLPAGSERQVTMTFGVTGRWTGQNVPVANLPFEVVATQPGVRPDAEDF